jgi:hypothetical protein
LLNAKPLLALAAVDAFGGGVLVAIGGAEVAVAA